jgi:hypothetical protein
MIAFTIFLPTQSKFLSIMLVIDIGHEHAQPQQSGCDSSLTHTPHAPIVALLEGALLSTFKKANREG